MQKQLFSSVSLAMLVLLGVAGCTSFEEIKERADGGDPSMQYRAGLCYRDGKDVQANPDTAYSYFKKAADGGSFAGALCYAQEALRRKDISEPAKFLERIQKVFTEQPRNSEDRDARWEMRRDYPKFCIEFAILLKNADAGMELVNFKKQAMRFFSKKYLILRNSVIAQYAAKLSSVRSKKEIAEAPRRTEEKRIAGEERRLAEKKEATGAGGVTKRSGKLGRRENVSGKERQLDNIKERVYGMLRNCPPRRGEDFNDWKWRAARGWKPSYNEQMAAQRVFEAVKRNLARQEKERIESEKSRIEEEFRKNGIKLYKHIYSTTPVRYFLVTLKYPMVFLEATRIGDDGTKYLIRTVRDEKRVTFTPENKEIEFIAGFQGVLRDSFVANNFPHANNIPSGVTKEFLCKEAPFGFLFGVKYNFDGNVSAEALAEKVKKDYPDAKEFPDRKIVIKQRGRLSRNVEFDVIAITKVWESERVRITGHYFLIEFTGKEKTLPEIQKQKLKEEITKSFGFIRWVKEQLIASKIREASLPLPPNGLIIIDKKVAEIAKKLALKAKERDVAEQEAVRKKKEQKSLDF